MAPRTESPKLAQAIYQKQIFCDPTDAGNRLSTVVKGVVFDPYQLFEGRRILKFQTSNLKINYFKLLGVRLKAVFGFRGAVPPLPNHFIDTYLGVRKVVLIDPAKPENFFMVNEGQELFVPLNFYDVYCYLSDYPDATPESSVPETLQDYHSETWNYSATNMSAVTNIENHHLPDHCYIQKLTNWRYYEHFIRACVEMEALPTLQR